MSPFAMPTILHVEDDLDLAELVKQTFEEFGFQANTIVAPNVADASRVLSDAAAYPTIDLVITDMRLPDGTGLDVLRSLRENPQRKHIPLLVLSGDSDPATVNRAYALGANAYVPKFMRERSAFQILRAMSAHWLNDVRIPREMTQSPTSIVVSTSVFVRRRFGELYMAYAQQLGMDSPEAGFWLDCALREGNLSNLFAFLAGQLGQRELPAELVDTIRQQQMGNVHILDELDRRPLRTAQDVERTMAKVIGNLDVEDFVRWTSGLFPAGPIVVKTLREAAATTLDSIASWIVSYSHDRALHAEVQRLHALAGFVRRADLRSASG